MQDQDCEVFSCRIFGDKEKTKNTTTEQKTEKCSRNQKDFSIEFQIT